ncbi:MAG TPA: hypothetical protein VGB47_04245 [Thermoanaerobaculia bacterium]|jgi:hypothetical protein
MGRINWGRVFLGGLAAGVIINLSETLLNAVIVRKDWEEAMRALGKDPAASMAGSAMAVWILWGFLAGIAAVWLYAAIRPRYGPGPRTAAIAGIGAWFFAGFLSNLAMLNVGLFPQRIIMIGLVWSLVEMIVATVVGAWLYKEA